MLGKRLTDGHFFHLTMECLHFLHESNTWSRNRNVKHMKCTSNLVHHGWTLDFFQSLLVKNCWHCLTDGAYGARLAISHSQPRIVWFSFKIEIKMQILLFIRLILSRIKISCINKLIQNINNQPQYENKKCALNCISLKFKTQKFHSIEIHILMIFFHIFVYHSRTCYRNSNHYIVQKWKLFHSLK